MFFFSIHKYVAFPSKLKNANDLNVHQETLKNICRNHLPMFIYLNYNFLVTNKDVFEDDIPFNKYTNFGEEKTKDIILTITFEEAAKGIIYQVNVNQKVVCPKCFGDRAELGYGGAPCKYCEGTGLETEKIGHIVTRRTCSYCEGSGIFIKFKCLECAGTGITIFGNLHE